MGRPGVAGKKRTRLGGRDPGDPPLRRWRCLCPWSKQRGNPPFSSARRAHSYSNDSAAGPRAATFPGPRELPPTPTFHLRSTSPGPLPLSHFQLRRGGVPGKAASPARTPGLLTNSAAGCGGPRGWRRVAGSDNACFFQFVGDSDKKEVKYLWCVVGLCCCSDRHKLGVRRSAWGRVLTWVTFFTGLPQPPAHAGSGWTLVSTSGPR